MTYEEVSTFNSSAWAAQVERLEGIDIKRRKRPKRIKIPKLKLETSVDRSSRAPYVRALLRQYPDGMTANEIASELGLINSTTNNILKKMPDVYIDRWIQVTPKAKYSAVWCAVLPPPNCPHPNKGAAE